MIGQLALLRVDDVVAPKVRACAHRRLCGHDAGGWLSIYCMSCGDWVEAIPIERVDVAGELL